MTILVRNLALGCVFAAASLGSEAQNRQITPDQAGDLVREWLSKEGYPTQSKRFMLYRDPDRSSFPEFYFFSASYEQEQSVPTLGHFAVSKKTADVWDWELCKRLSNPRLRATQKELRERIGVSDSAYRKMSRTAPCSGST